MKTSRYLWKCKSFPFKLRRQENCQSRLSHSESSPWRWDMTNPIFSSRQFMIMKWSRLSGYQNFIESRPLSFSSCSLISIQVQHRRTGAATAPQAASLLLTDTWRSLLEGKNGRYKCLIRKKTFWGWRRSLNNSCRSNIDRLLCS